MKQGKKKQAAGNANAPKKLVATFGKKKVRIGKQLKRDNATDTRVSSKKVFPKCFSIDVKFSVIGRLPRAAQVK